MREARVLILAVLSMLALGNVVSACESGDTPDVVIDKRIAIHPDGSFENAGDFDNAGYFVGAPIVDLGKGRIGQKLAQSTDCFPIESLLYVDCNSGETILVQGDEFGIREIQYPNGPIRLSKMSVSDVAKVAQANDYPFTVDVLGSVEKMKKKNRYDPFFGCNLFYPESKGAISG